MKKKEIVNLKYVMKLLIKLRAAICYFLMVMLYHIACGYMIILKAPNREQYFVAEEFALGPKLVKP